MTYRIFEHDGLIRRTVAKNLATIEDGRAFLARWGELVAFDLDPEHDAADAALHRHRGGGGQLQIYAIERED
jgi:hypothetical protein